jgi:acyl carrier protein
MHDERYSACLGAVMQVFGSTVNADQSFFDLGGDSLHAIELVMRIRQVADIDVNAFEMVNAPSLREFLQVRCQAAAAAH